MVSSELTIVNTNVIKNRTQVLIQDSDIDGDENCVHTELESGIENFIPLFLTPQQFNRVLSAVFEGASLVYPEASNQIYWDFLKGLECGMQFCDYVLDCFNDSAFAQSWVDAMAGHGIDIGGQSGTGASGAGAGSSVLGDILPAGLCTDNDGLFGYCMQVVATMDRFVVDFLEIVQAQASAIELAGSLVGLIPIFGSYVEKAISFSQKYFNVLEASYNASYTLEVQEIFACELYSIAKQNCILTLDDIIAGYGNAMTQPLSPTSFDDFLDIFLDLPTTIGLEFVGVCHYSVLGIMQFAQKFLGFSLQSIPIFSGAYSDYPVPAECVITWCVVMDFTVDAYASLIQTGNFCGSTCVYNAGLGYSGNTPSNLDRLYVAINFDSAYITEISVTLSAILSTGNKVWQTIKGDCTDIQSVAYDGLTSHTLAVNQNLTAFKTGIERTGADTATLNRYITALTIRGQGDKPAQFAGLPTC